MTAQQKLAAMRQQRKETTRNQTLDAAIAKADAAGKRDSLPQEGKDFVNASQSNARMAIDPDGSGGYRPSEAATGQAAEAQGQLPAPVRRATEKADPAEAGADLVDGAGQTWDQKDASMGAEDIAETAKSGENVLVDCNRMSDDEVNDLMADVNSRLSPDEQQRVVFVKRNDPV